MRNELDELDKKILAVLQANARVPNVEVARRLGVSEGTIRNRIKKMVASGLLDIVARINFYKLGYKTDAYIGIKVLGGGHVREIASALSKMDETRYVGITTGRFDIWVFANFKSDQELRDFLLDKLPQVGNFTTETLHVLDIAKGLTRLGPQGEGSVPLTRL